MRSYELIEQKDFIAKMVNDGKGLTTIAKLLECSPPSLYRFCDKHGIDYRNRVVVNANFKRNDADYVKSHIGSLNTIAWK